MPISIAEIIEFLDLDPDFAKKTSDGLKTKSLDIHDNKNLNAWEFITDACDGVRENKWKNLTHGQRIITLFKIIEFLPSYTASQHLYSAFVYDQMDLDAEHELWEGILGLLASDEKALREPIEYVLWVDFFEDTMTCRRAWAGLTRKSMPRKVQDRLLVIAGPVPFKLKKPYYNILISNPLRHAILAESLAHSLNDIYGKIDIVAAKTYTKGLQLPSKNPHLKFLKEKLNL